MSAKLFPKQQHAVSVCNHKNGADITVSMATDTLQEPSKVVMERLAFKYNHPLGAYVGPHYGVDHYDMQQQERLGSIRHDLYFNQGAAATALNYTGLTLNPSDYPAVMAAIKEWIKYNSGGRMFAAVSFAGGNEGYAANTKNDFGFGRNSNSGGDNYGKVGATFLGLPALDYSPNNYSNRSNTTRWWDNRTTVGSDDPAVLLTYVETALLDTLAHGGWYRDFVHWHAIRTEGNILYQEQFIQKIASVLTTANKVAWKCSSGEAVEYMALREYITRVSCCDVRGGTTLLAYEINIPSGEAFMEDVLNTPISIQVDLSNSQLAGKAIKCPGCEIISKGGDVYIINVPYKGNAENGRITLVEITEGVQAYRTGTRPTATVTRGATSATITTSVPTISTIFSRLTGQDDTMWLKHTRQMNYTSSRTITGMNFTTREYCIGISDGFKVMNLYNL